MTTCLQKKSPYYYVILYIYDRDCKRKAKWIPTRAKSKLRAQEIEREIVKRYQETGTLPIGKNHAYIPYYESDRNSNPYASGNIPFCQYLLDWLATRMLDIRATTQSAYDGNVKGRILRYFQPLGKRLSEITPTDIELFLASILEDGCKKNTAQHYYAVLHKAFEDAVAKDMLMKNPMDKVRRPKKEPYFPETRNPTEVKEILDCFKDDPIYLCILVIVCYGLRREEAIGLKWSAIDFEEKRITIRHTVTEATIDGKTRQIEEDNTKSASSYRTLPLIPPVMDALIEAKRKRDINMWLLGNCYNHQYDEYIFVDVQGKRFRPGYVTDHFALVLKQNGLKKMRIHDLRHSCGTILSRNKVPVTEIQQWLGHSDIATTSIYIHLNSEDKQEAADSMAASMTQAGIFLPS